MTKQSSSSGYYLFRSNQNRTVYKIASGQTTLIRTNNVIILPCCILFF